MNWESYRVMSIKKRILFLLIIPVIVISAFFLDISFSIPLLNTLAFLIALMSFIMLSITCSSIKLKWYFDLMLGIGWLFSILMGIFLLLCLIDNRNPDLQNISESQFCTQSMYGFVGTDGGKELCAYKRYWIFDTKIGCHRTSDMYQSPKDVMDIQTICKDKKIINI